MSIILLLKIVLCIGIVLCVLVLISKPFSIYVFDKAQRNQLEGQAVVFTGDDSVVEGGTGSLGDSGDSVKK